MASLDRNFIREGKNLETLKVYHALFKFEEGEQGGGRGSWMIGNMFEKYEALGVKRVDVSTAWVGNYYWANVGFEMKPEYIDSLAGNLKRKLRQHVQNGLITNDKADELLNMFRDDPTDFARLKKDMPIVKFRDPDGKMTKGAITKEFMMGPGSRGWSGHLMVGSERWKVARARLDASKAKGEAERLKAAKKAGIPLRTIRDIVAQELRYSTRSDPTFVKLQTRAIMSILESRFDAEAFTRQTRARVERAIIREQEGKNGG